MPPNFTKARDVALSHWRLRQCARATSACKDPAIIQGWGLGNNEQNEDTSHVDVLRQATVLSRGGGVYGWGTTREESADKEMAGTRGDGAGGRKPSVRSNASRSELNLAKPEPDYYPSLAHASFAWAGKQAYIERDIVLVELRNVSVSGNDALVTDWHHRVWATSHDDQVRNT